MDEYEDESDVLKAYPDLEFEESKLFEEIPAQSPEKLVLMEDVVFIKNLLESFEHAHPFSKDE